MIRNVHSADFSLFSMGKVLNKQDLIPSGNDLKKISTALT